MLVLTRKVGEKIQIGDNITITITDILPQFRVRIGIDAPRDVSIMRTELMAPREGDKKEGTSDAADRS